MDGFVYQSEKPYITEDERKLSEKDISAIAAHVCFESVTYFNFIVTRLVPDKWDSLAMIDRVALKCMGKFGAFAAGRVLIAGHLR